MGEVMVRPARREDLDMLVAIERECFAPGEAFDRVHIRRLLRNPAGSVIAEVILLENEVVGWGCWM